VGVYLVASSQAVAVGVTVVATLVVAFVVVAAALLLAAVRDLRRQADDLARESSRLLSELAETVQRAGLEVERVDRMVGSAEAISDAVGSASRLVGGAVATPFIKVMAFGSGLVRGARLVRSGPPPPAVPVSRAAGGRRGPLHRQADGRPGHRLGRGRSRVAGGKRAPS
jgi:hypothetical protein